MFHAQEDVVVLRFAGSQLWPRIATNVIMERFGSEEAE